MEPKDWQAEFDKALDDAFDEHGEHGEIYDGKAFGEDIKSFISNLLLEQKKKAIEAIYELKPVADIDVRGGAWLIGRSEALKKLELL